MSKEEHIWQNVPDMTYNVFGGTLNLAQLNSTDQMKVEPEHKSTMIYVT